MKTQSYVRIITEVLITKNGSINSLQTESRDTQGYPRGKLDEEYIEGIEEGFMTVDLRVLNLEVIHYIGKHRPEQTNNT